MIFGKINIYLFLQISKYFFLILFIFLSIAWLLQITRLFTITNFMHINFLDIILLSIYLIPNLINVITPFILIFGLLLCFVRLNNDNELIAILSLGGGLKTFRNTLFFFSFIILIFFILLNFYFAPIIYKQYKINENELRNTLDFDKMMFSNFLNLNKTTILDFKKNNNEYNHVFISFNDEKENIVYAKKGNIYNENNQYKFQLSNGFKISVDKENQIEKLEFLNYILKIDKNNITRNEIIDKNTLTILDDIKNRDKLNIVFKAIDIFLIIFVIFFFYNNNLKKINFKFNNNIYYVLVCISILIINQINKNSDVSFNNYLITTSIIIFLSFMLTWIKKKYE